MTPREYWTACRLHDWFYMMSEASTPYWDGLHREQELQRIAATDPVLADIFDAWQAHKFESGPVPPEPKLED